MYRRYFKEQKELPDWIDSKVTNILKILRDEDFQNEDARKKFIDLITSVYNSKDKRARLLFKKLGNFLTEIGDDLIKYGTEE